MGGIPRSFIEMKKIILNSVLLLVTLALIFAVGEMFTRIFEPPPMQVVKHFSDKPLHSNVEGLNLVGQGSPDTLYQYSLNGGVRLTPNAQILIKNHYLSHLDIEISTNSLGFRSPELPRGHREEPRILVLGDSITLGDYVNEDQTYPSRIEAYLKKDGAPIRVVNAGIGSADIHNEYEILSEAGIQSEPDIVLIGLYLNDGELSANLVISPLPGLLSKSYFASYLNRKIKLILYRWEHRQELAGSDQAWIHQFTAGRKLTEKNWVEDQEGFDYLIVKNARDWGAAWNPLTWKIIEDYFLKMEGLAEQRHFKLAVVLFPVRYQVEAKYLYDIPQRYFEGLMTKLKIPHFDLLPVLRQLSKQTSSPTLYFDKCHLTPEGNDIVGKSIAEFLLRNNSPLQGGVQFPLENARPLTQAVDIK